MIYRRNRTPSLLQNRWLAQWPGQDELAETILLRRSDLLRDGVGGELSAGVFCQRSVDDQSRAQLCPTTDVLGFKLREVSSWRTRPI